MAKYTFEFKKKVVFEYLYGKIGSTTLAKKYNIKSQNQVRQWIHNYQEFGDEGLKRSRKKETYSFEFKLHMVESYLSNEVSYEELALSNGITNYTTISRWVETFRVAGPDGLRPRKKGRKKTLDKPAKNNNSQLLEEKSIDTSAEHVKELEDELLKLRIENAFLKELRSLRLEDEAKMRERHESSAASEDSLN
jgi:transposase